MAHVLPQYWAFLPQTRPFKFRSRSRRHVFSIHVKRMPNTYYECGSCWKSFPAGWTARENHCRSTGHSRPTFECDSCHRNFGSETARFQHMDATNHFDHECSICDETWPTASERKTHEIEEHFYCLDCNRSFQNLNNIQMVRGLLHIVMASS